MEETMEEYLLLKQQLSEQRLAKRIDDVSYGLHLLEKERKEMHASEIGTLKKGLEELKKGIDADREKTESLASMLAEIIRNEGAQQEKECPHLKDNYYGFWETLLLRNKKLQLSSQFMLSPIVPFEWYDEYELCGYGKEIYFFLYGYRGAVILVEIVKENRIVSKSKIILKQDGSYMISTDEIRGKIGIRFRACNKASIARLLVFKQSKNTKPEKNNLAAYIM